MQLTRLLWLSLFISGLVAAQPQTQDFSTWPIIGEVKLLDADQQQFVSVWLEEQTPQKRGTALLLPDWGRSPSDARGIDALRQALPDIGWETGAILPPQPSKNIMQSGGDLEQLANYKLQLKAVLETAKQTQQEQFGFQVIIAQGVMGAWLVELLAEQQIPAPDGIVLISAYYPDKNLNIHLATQTALLAIPVLDIYADDYNQWQASASKQRLIATNKNQKFNYRQTLLPATADTAPNSATLNKTVYGWFSSLGWY
ncbi:DUF3530 family protein [Agarivorans sp. MS3-6]